MSHHHFTLEDRNSIQYGLERSESQREIARHLGVSHTAINNEIRCNSVVLEIVVTTRVNRPRIVSLDLRTKRGKGEVPEKIASLARYRQRLARFERGQPVYVADIAQTFYLERRQEVGRSHCILSDNTELAKRITALLMSKDRDSPEQIAANFKKIGVFVGYQTIYRWIRKSSKRKELEKCLRRRGKRYRYISTTVANWNKTKDKRSIHSRPVVIETLTRYGDLEGDTIFGSDTKDRILTHVDRVTGLASLSLVLGYDSHKIYTQTISDITRVFGFNMQTITYDNGSEFSAWKKTEKKLGVDIYFADPYKSCQRGRNENTNGLVRDYFPKGTDFKKIAKQEIREVEDILNNRSRKRYDWHSPFEQRELVLGIA